MRVKLTCIISMITAFILSIMGPMTIGIYSSYRGIPMWQIFICDFVMLLNLALVVTLYKHICRQSVSRIKLICVLAFMTAFAAAIIGFIVIDFLSRNYVEIAIVPKFSSIFIIYFNLGMVGQLIRIIVRRETI